MPDIAVITPTFNRATLLPAALDSVVAQTTDASIEIAVVDDGSTDNTQDVMRPYLERFGDDGGRLHVTYTRLEKQGVVAARNTAIAQTSAPLIAFLDSDDYWETRKLAMQLDAMRVDDAVGVVHTSFRYVDESDAFRDDGPQRLNNPCVGDCLDVLLNEFLVVFSSAMIRRDIVERIASEEAHGQPFDPRWVNSQDYDLMLRAARHCRFAYVAEPLTLYRVHGAHGAMGNLKRAYGFHCRVQIDFVKRHGASIGMDEDEARGRAAAFLLGRVESHFWQRDFVVARELCDVARELDVLDERFAAYEKRMRTPKWVYAVKDRLDRVIGRGGRGG